MVGLSFLRYSFDSDLDSVSPFIESDYPLAGGCGLNFYVDKNLSRKGGLDARLHAHYVMHISLIITNLPR